MTLPDVTPSEFATILAGLSELQRRGHSISSLQFFNDEGLTPLRDGEIDALAERLNTEKVPASVVLTSEKRDRAWEKLWAVDRRHVAGGRMAFDLALDTLYDPHPSDPTNPCAPAPASGTSAPVAYEPDAQTLADDLAGWRASEEHDARAK